MLEETAAAGLPEAMHHLGIDLIDEGHTRRGRELVAAACNQGYALAWSVLGDWLEDGTLGEPDLVLARAAFTAAAAVEEIAAADLAIMWRDGVGGPADANEARRWYDQAARLGYDWSDDDRWRTRRRRA